MLGSRVASWYICDPIKKVSGPKIFSGPTPGPQSSAAGKFEYLKFWNFWLRTQIWALKWKKGPSFGLLSHRYSSYLSNAKDLRSFAQKLAELEQFLFGPLDFSEILDFPKKAVFADFGSHFKIFFLYFNPAYSIYLILYIRLITCNQRPMQ